MKNRLSPMRFGARAGVAFVLSLLLIGALSMAPRHAEGQAALLVNIATDATDPQGFDDSEPSIAVNPLNPLEIAVIGFCEGMGQGFSAPIWKSTNGGLTWTKKFILPIPPAGGDGVFDQKIAYSGSGNIIYTGLTFDTNGNIADYVWRQTGTANDPLVPGGVFGDDQPHVTIDGFAGSPFLDRVYAPFLNFAQNNPQSTVAWSPDLGITMNPVGAGNNAQFPNRTTRIAVAPGGSVYIIYKTREGPNNGDFQASHFWVSRSDDGGLTWGANAAGGVSPHGPGTVDTWFTSAWGNPNKGPYGRARSSDAWIAVNPTNGDIWAAYCSKDQSGFGQVYAAQSTDQGVTWANYRVTDGTHHTAFPEIAVTPNGTVGVLCVDYDDSGPVTIFNHHFLRSFDSGSSWSDEILHSMDASLSANASIGFLWGDYEGVTAVGNRFYGVFTGNSLPGARSSTQFDPIFFTQNAIPPFITLSINPSSVPAGAGATGTVKLADPAPTGGADVAISSDDPATASGPPSVFIAEGDTTATFDITTDPNTTPAKNVTFTADYSGHSSQATINVYPFIAGIEFWDESIFQWVPALDVFGGAIVQARVLLTKPAQEGGVVVSLGTTDPEAAITTPSVTVQAGRTDQTFIVFTKPIPATEPVLVFGQAQGSLGFGTLIVHAPVPSAVTVTPPTVTGGSQATGTVYLTSPAPPGGIAIALASSNTSVATVLPYAIVQQSKTSATFPIMTVPVTANKVVQISASNEGVTRSANLTVTPLAGLLSSLVFNPSTVNGGTQAKGVVILTRPAPSGGLVVTLTKGPDPQGAIGTLPTVTVPAGYSSATFYAPTNWVPVDSTVTITATSGTSSKSANLTVRAPHVTSVTAIPVVIHSGTQTTVRVFMSGASPTDITVPITYTGPVTGPSSITVLAGKPAVSFLATGTPVTASTTAKITATYPVGQSKTATITVTP